MIGTIAGWLMARNAALTLPYARKIAKVGIIGAAIVLAVGGFIAWDWWDDRQAVKQANAERMAEEAREALEASRRANTAAIIRDAARAADDDATEDELEDIHAEDPDAAAAPASAGNRAVADRLR